MRNTNCLVSAKSINKVMFYHSKRLFTQGSIIPINLIQVWFKLVLTGSNKLSCCQNLRLDRWSSPALPLNLGPDLGPVLQSSGSNFGSGLNCGITIHNTNMYKHKLYACPILYLLHLWQCHLFDYPGPQFMWELYLQHHDHLHCLWSLLKLLFPSIGN